MPTTKLIKSAWNAGELSQYMDGRTDLSKYYNAASKLINALVLPHGGFTKRPGTIYKATSATRANLIPFEFSVGDALILEWSNLLLRFYKDQDIVNDNVGTEDLSGVDGGALVAHWLLNETESVTVVNADNPGTYDGTATVDAATLTATGKVGTGCFDLDGQYAVEIADAAAFSFTDDSDDSAFSFVCWGKVTNKGGLQVLLSKWKEDTATEWRFSLSNDRKLQLHLSDNGVATSGTAVSQWKLNEDAANTSVVDTIGLQDGVSTTNTSTLAATGKISGAFDFDDQYAVEVNDNAAYSFGDGADDDPFSIAAWIYVTAGFDNKNHILSKYDETTGSEAREWRTFISTLERFTFVLYDESANAYLSKSMDSNLSVGWHFVVGTYDGRGGAAANDGINLYVDGFAVATDKFSGGTYDSMEATATKVVIGANYGTDGNLGNFFDDKIDNVILYSTELTATDVENLWNSGNGTESTNAVKVNVISDSAISTGWHFFVCTYSAPADATTAADGMILYVDGVAVSSTATNNASYTSMIDTATKVRIGAQLSAAAANENFWEDKIDEVSIFSDVLTPTEVASLYSETPYSIVSPYTTVRAFGIHYTQSADVMYIAHNDVFPKKLSRNDTLDWTIVDVPFTGGPFLIENTNDDFYVQFARVGGTAEADYYFPKDASGTLTATGTGNEPFNSNMVGALWLVKHTRIVDNTTSTPDNSTNSAPTLIAYPKAVRTKGDFVFNVTTFAAGDIAKLWRKQGNGSWQEFRTFTAATAYSATEDEDDVYYAFTIAAGDTVVAEFTAKNQTNYGIVKITGFTSATVVTCIVVDPILTNNSGTSATTSMWAEGAWSTYRGFPRTVGFHEDRLWWASSTNDPDKKWSSQSGLYENMAFTTGLDNEAVTAIVKDNEVSQIQWMMSRRVMAIGAANREYSFSAQNPEDPITPLDKKSTPQTGFSSGSIQPVMLNDSIFFLQRQGKKLGAMKFDSVTENFIVDDATLLAYGLLDSPPTNMAVSRSPDSLIWVVRTDGVMPTFAYEPKEEVSGWGRQIFGNSAAVETPTGFVESAAVIHGTTEDEIWVNVRRVIDSSTVYYTELFSPRDWGSDIKDAIFGIDSVFTYDGAETEYIDAGIDHLVGETVSVFADGEVFDDAVVNANGYIDLKKATVTTGASVVQVGLPYTMKGRSMRLAVPQVPSALQTKIKRVTSVTVRYIRSLLGSAGTEYGGTEYLTDIEAAYSTESADTDENFRATEGGFNEDNYTTILSDDPVPFTALATITEVEV